MEVAIINAIAALVAGLAPHVQRAITGGRTVEEWISDARAAVHAIPTSPAADALEEHARRVRAEDDTREVPVIPSKPR